MTKRESELEDNIRAAIFAVESIVVLSAIDDHVRSQLLLVINKLKKLIGEEDVQASRNSER